VNKPAPLTLVKVNTIGVLVILPEIETNCPIANVVELVETWNCPLVPTICTADCTVPVLIFIPGKNELFTVPETVNTIGVAVMLMLVVPAWYVLTCHVPLALVGVLLDNAPMINVPAVIAVPPLPPLRTIPTFRPAPPVGALVIVNVVPVMLPVNVTGVPGAIVLPVLCVVAPTIPVTKAVPELIVAPVVTVWLNNSPMYTPPV
jgi:hypothetical protein